MDPDTSGKPDLILTRTKTGTKFPIVYSTYYDIKMFGLEKVHAFDSCKWGRIINSLIGRSKNQINMKNIHEPTEASHEDLLIGHTPEYLKELTWSSKVARILEVSVVAAIPNYIVNRTILKRFRFQVKGTMTAAKLALSEKWAINVGGGFHHASKNGGAGFCVYADISIAIKALQKENPEYKFLIVDLDAHQGNGHENDFPSGSNVFIMDIYNRGIYPNDEKAKENIDVNVPLISWTNDTEYMTILKEKLDESFAMVTPDLLVYNAGTDCLAGDPLGRLDITPKGIMDRDELVFQTAKDKSVPIVMVTSGGYQHSNAEIISDSIWNLFEKRIIE